MHAKPSVGLLVCGSFNPPTIMHLRMLEVARDHLHKKNIDVSLGIMSPVADSYGKPHLVKAFHRLAMLKAATTDSHWIKTDGWECSQTSWTRTLDVLSYHRTRLRGLGEDNLNMALVVGGDVVETFDKILPNGENLWNPEDVRKIVLDYGLIVIARESTDPIKTLKAMPILEDICDRIEIVTDEACPCNVSSTRLRKAIAEKRSIKYATPDRVIAYISEHNLYS